MSLYGDKAAYAFPPYVIEEKRPQVFLICYHWICVVYLLHKLGIAIEAGTYNSHVIRDYIFVNAIPDNMRIFYFAPVNE
jgi:hypothetical protein